MASDNEPASDGNNRAPQVFVSHSSQDAIAALQIVTELEAQGVRCWIAPRDIPAGEDWNHAIMSAINEATALLLVLTRHSVDSDPVKREVERAVARKITVVPVRLEQAAPSPALEFLISTRQWVDAHPPPLDRHLANVVAEVKRALHLAHDRPTADPQALPDYVGPYRVLGLLGEGGMGAVYRAEQRVPVKRTVALKLIKAGCDTKEVIARFSAEQQALARMDHPHVAKVLEAGADERGRPYFVMEYVPGVPITQFADEKKLSIRQRLELFQQVCGAVTHAHTKGLIHRDIKASNVLACLVDGQPSVKVIDFGIAKALTGEKLTDRTLTVGIGQVIGTYGSMSPEQAMGSADIDTRTDVYSLGVLLYELLVGAMPFDEDTLAQAADEEKLRLIQDVEPPKPSTRVSSLGEPGAEVAAARGINLDALARDLRSELEWIPLKALRKERDRRYQTPGDLADDIGNYLSGRALVAAPESRVYRLRKWARRNRAGLATATAFVLVVAISVGAYIQGIQAEQQKTAAARDEAIRERTAADRARNEALDANSRLAKSITELERVNADLVAARDEATKSRDEAQRQGELALQTLKSVIDDIQTQLENVPNMHQLRSDLLKPAMTGLEAISASLANDPRVDRSKAAAHTALGNLYVRIGGADGFGGIGLAHNEFDRALEINRKLAEADPKNAEAQRELSESCSRLGDVSDQEGDLLAARKFFEQCLEISRRLAEADPKNARAQRELAVSYLWQGEVSLHERDLAAARKFFQQDLEISRRLTEADPKNAQAQRELSESCSRLGDVSDQEGDLLAARKFFEQCLEISRRLAEADPKNARAQRELAVSYLWQGEVSLHERDLAAARKFFQQDLEISRRLTEADPKNAQAQRDLSYSCNRLGEISLKEGDCTAARKFFEQCLEINRRLAVADPKNAQAQRELATSYNRAGDVCTRGCDPEAAREHFVRRLLIDKQLAADDPANGEAQFILAVGYLNLATAERSRLDFAAARIGFEQANEILERLASNSGFANSAKSVQAIVRSRLRDCELGPVAVGKWDDLLAPPADKQCELLALRCRLFSGTGEVATAVEAAVQLGELPLTTAKQFHQAAAAYAQLAAASLYGKVEDEGRREELRRKYAELAIAALGKAIDAGFDDAAGLGGDSNFWLLASTPEFKALVARAGEAAAKQAPAAKNDKEEKDAVPPSPVPPR